MIRHVAFVWTLTVAWLMFGSGQPLTSAMAAVINYQESVDGDLPESGFPLPTLDLGIGVNTVSGRMGLGAIYDFDAFAFTVPNDAVLVSGLLELENVSGNSGVLINAGWALHSEWANSGWGTLLETINTTPGGSAWFTSTPLGTDVYNLTVNSFAYGGDAPVLVDWKFTFTVAPVPEPCSLTLLTVGFCIPLRLRHRR